jgi:hypothetical protein
MKKKLFYYCLILLTFNACNNNSTHRVDVRKTSAKEQAKEETKEEGSSAITQYVVAKINGVVWKSIPSEILAKYDSYNDKLNIFTQDEKGIMNFLLTLAPFSKTQIGAYSSLREGAGGYGISLLDENRKDDIENDYDNFHQGAVANCLMITSIKEVKGGKMVEGTFASPMNVSNNYDASKKGVIVSEGKFAVFVEN